MRDIAFNPTDWSLQRSGTGLTMVSGVDALVQRLRIRCSRFRREWYLDINTGIPYIDVVFVKNPNRSAVESAFKQTILSCPEVAQLLQFQMTSDSAERKIFVRFTVLSTSGDEVTLEV